MLYMESTSSDEGSYSLNITFAAGTDPDLAAIDVQNRVSQAVAQLPTEAQQNGVQVRKRATNLMMGVSLYSPENTHTPLFVSNYASTQVREALSRLPGVGQVQMFGARDYSMRIWLRPDRMNALNVTSDDVAQALREQNVQGAAGQVGTPPVFNGQQQTLTINGLGRLSQAEDFADIIIRAGEMGQLVRLKDVATIELGSRSYSSGARLNGHDSAYLGIYPTPSANALRVADAVRAELDRLSTRFPDDLVYEVKFDTTSFVAATIKEIGVSLALTLLAVVVVVSLFLQSWRATLIVALAIPVSLVGTFAVLYTLGYSANTLSLFAIILALTMVVDDAIVVVESVETLMAEGQSRTAAPDCRAGHRDDAGAAGGVCAGSAPAGDCRRAVPPVCGDALDGRHALEPRGADPDARPVRDAPASAPGKARSDFPWVQPGAGGHAWRLHPHRDCLQPSPVAGAAGHRRRGGRGGVQLYVDAKRLPAAGGSGLLLRQRSAAGGGLAGAHRSGDDHGARTHR